MTIDKRKLIEVSLPLEVINRESAREKSIRHGHPSTLHLWWARRPLAAARAVLFAQLVDDPSSHPDRYPTEEDQQHRREELHALIEKLVVWENSNDADILAEAHKEILDSTGGNPPAILDPFAGGGTIPLEAQRLGLNAIASDLNPVAVLINKALIEIPPKFRSKKPAFPDLADSQIRTWKGAEGLAADVRAYGEWIRDEANKRIGHLYPKATLPDGSKATVIAWIWARTVTCPNPRCGARMPLVRSWWLGKKKGKEAYVVPQFADGQVHFSIGHDPKAAPTADTDGTIGRAGANCLACRSAVDREHIKAEGMAGRMAAQLVATVAEGNRTRIYLPPSPEQEAAAAVERPANVPDQELGFDPRNLWTPPYGLTKFSDLFTSRQLIALTTFSDLVVGAREKVLAEALSAGQLEGERLADGGTDAAAYADAVATYLGFALSRMAEKSSSISTWSSGIKMEAVRGAFARQALPMTWDFAESNPWGGSGGDYLEDVLWVSRVLRRLPAALAGFARQADAQSATSEHALVSTDPPYYDNIGYSDLSDFFYVWLRRSLRPVWPELLATILVPKAEELVANPYRHNGNEGAKRFFESGFATVFANAREHALHSFPITVFYAFKQSESTSEGTSSSGWETLLEGMVRSGWMITGTWPLRSERSGRMISIGTNALASSVVLALRPRGAQAPVVDRRGFIAALKSELPARLRELQQGAIAPVDLPQAAIGPGMAVFTRYAKVIESDGSMMSVRSALASINSARDQVLWEMVGDFDATTRFAITWYRQHGYKIGAFGDANNMANGHNTSVAAMERAGILTSRGGNVALISPAALPVDYDPVADMDISAWEVLHHLIRVLDSDGVAAAGVFLVQVGSRADGGIDPALVKELAFLLFSVADTKKWTTDAIAFNNIATSWSDLIDASRSGPEPSPADLALDFATDEEEV
jgi:putative DNA methylase